MGVKINSTGGGSVTLDTPSTASNLTVTLPSASGTLTTTSGSTFADITVTGNSYFATSSGNVGIGTSSPVNKLQVSGGIAAAGAAGSYSVDGLITEYSASISKLLACRTGGNYSEMTFSTAGANSSGVVTERMRIDSSGNVGIGVVPNSSYPAKLNLYDTADCTMRITKGGVVASSIKAVTTALAFGVDAVAGDTERMRLDVNGNLLVGTTSAGLQNNNSQQLIPSAGYGVMNHVSGTANGTAYLYFGFNGTGIGTITQNTNSTVAYNTSSDYRLKENIQPMQNALARNALLKPCTYSWKADGSTGEGFIAHELQAVCPNAVTGEKDALDEEGNPVYQGVDASFLVGHLVACINELKAELDELKAKVK